MTGSAGVPLPCRRSWPGDLSSKNLRPVAVTSEGIFFQAKLQDQRRLYQVKLDGDTLQMTFLFAFPA